MSTITCLKIKIPERKGLIRKKYLFLFTIVIYI